jgi:uncharacterized membrane protein YgaE (UPF0421/DUF939 family)
MRLPRGAVTFAERWAGVAWPLAQQSLAAAVAWVIAVRVAGHADPFFAPVAAVVGLNATLGRRGSNAVRLLAGVLIGVLVGVLAALVGGGAWTLVAATFLAMLIARTIDDAPIIRAQAGVSAILVIVLGQPQEGWDRLVDAVIGAAVALVFSQLLFSPEPLRLLRRAEATVLSSLADSLRTIAAAVEHGDRQKADAATEKLRSLRDDLAAVSTMRLASDRIIRHGLAWRRRARLVVTERERAGHLDLLAGSCLMLARTATAVAGPGGDRLAAIVRQLAAAMDDLAVDPGDRARRQHCAERAGALATWLADTDGQAPAGSAGAAAYASIGLIAADVMVFAGVEPEPTLGGGPHPTRRDG